MYRETRHVLFINKSSNTKTKTNEWDVYTKNEKGGNSASFERRKGQDKSKKWPGVILS